MGSCNCARVRKPEVEKTTNRATIDIHEDSAHFESVIKVNSAKINSEIQSNHPMANYVFPRIPSVNNEEKP